MGEIENRKHRLNFSIHMQSEGVDYSALYS